MLFVFIVLSYFSLEWLIISNLALRHLHGNGFSGTPNCPDGKSVNHTARPIAKDIANIIEYDVGPEEGEEWMRVNRRADLSHNQFCKRKRNAKSFNVFGAGGAGEVYSHHHRVSTFSLVKLSYDIEWYLLKRLNDFDIWDEKNAYRRDYVPSQIRLMCLFFHKLAHLMDFTEA